MSSTTRIPKAEITGLYGYDAEAIQPQDAR